MSAQTTDAPMVLSAQDGSGAMFDRIAAKYDRLNRVISLGLDRGWRRALVAALEGSNGGPRRVLDVATGTADVALDIAKAWPEAHVVGLDPSVGMLSVGQRKVQASPRPEAVQLTVGDGQALPFTADQFDAACISFGIRNVPDRVKGLEEMVRVTRKGGRVVVLELSEPRGWSPMAIGARLHVHLVVPLLGAWLSSAHEYRYLQKSVAAFPPPDEFARLMEGAGLKMVQLKRLAFGAAWLYIAEVV